MFWYTKDLRVDDLPALAEAAAHSDVVIPVYIWDELYLEDEAENRRAFLLDCLKDLDVQLRKVGSGLLIETGDTVRALVALCETHDCKDVYCTESRDPHTKRLQQAVANGLGSVGMTLHSSGSNFLLDPDSIKTKAGSIYRVFTPFRNAALPTLKVHEARPVASSLTQSAENLILPRPKLAASHDRQQGGASEASRLWTAFKGDGLTDYHESRNDVANEHGTSKLSAHLNFGTISVNTLARELLSMSDPAGQEGRVSFMNELIWREFNAYVVHHFPEVLNRAFREELIFIKWRGKQEHLEAWKEGMTGYPVVDAAMRQLKQTGWMHNRARMIVASFLVKDLLINWQEGEAHFMEWLTDGDQVQNNAGWQWSASTGADAQPYFRIFNPITQGKKFDPKGEYIRRFVPELRNRPDTLIHQINVRDGLSYPNAIVDHATQREKALAMFKEAMTNFRK